MKKALNPLFLLIAFLLLEAVLFLYVDQPVSAAMNDLDTTFHGFVNFFRLITDLAKAKWHLLLSALSCVICALTYRSKINLRTRQNLVPIAHGCLAYFLAIASSGIIVNLFKDVLGRARPVLFDREGLYGFFPFHFDSTYNSMPSGHATTAMALAVILFLLDRKRGALWISLGILLCASRVIVNAHYLSDIVAGGMLGSFCAAAVMRNINHNGINLIISRIFPIDRDAKPN